MKYGFHSQAQRWLNLVFPPRCGCCGDIAESHGRLCAQCWSQITFLHRPWCSACGYPFPYEMANEKALCAACLERKPHYDGHRSMLKYDAHSKKLILDLKFHDKPLLLPLFGQWLEQASGEFSLPGDSLIVPIPLHYWRLVGRRYNQAALLAQALAKRSGIPVLPDGVMRIKRRPPQASLHRTERMKNMRGVFAVNAKHKAVIAGKTILLVDDVMTTGATLNACARVLKRAGAAKVYAATVARTVLED